jgi:integrase
VTAKRGERILGPYQHHSGWQIIEVAADGTRESTLLLPEAKAQRWKKALIANLAKEEHTTESALDAYKRHLAEKGNAAAIVQRHCVGDRAVLPGAARAEHVVDEALRCSLRGPANASAQVQATSRVHCVQRPVAVDTHRNALAQTRSFLAWYVERGWLRENPLAGVKDIGKRRLRGKSLGKEGNTLRVKEARAWYAKAIELAASGDQGAIAALVAMLLGMRASEIVSRVVSDLDEDAAPGDLLWIPCSKTPAGRRTLEVPEVLRPFLVACCEGKATTGYFFEAESGAPHWRDWIIGNEHRICGAAKVPRVTAHAMRGLLATITAERGLAGHLIAATLGHEDERTTMHAYAAPGGAAAGVARTGLVLLQGGQAGRS